MSQRFTVYLLYYFADSFMRWKGTLIVFRFQSNYKEMMARYKQLLTYIKSAVTRNHSEKSINSILDYISTSKNVSFSIGRQKDCSHSVNSGTNERKNFKGK